MDINRTHSNDHIINLAQRRIKGGFGNQRISMDDREFRAVLEGEGLSKTSTERTMRVLRHFLGMLNEMPEEFTSGHNEMGSSSDCYNIIPNDAASGICTDIVVTLASTRGHRLHRFTSVMRDLRSHLIECSHSTELVLIITDVWDPQKFRESEADLKSHIRKGVKFVPGLIAGDRLIPLPLPFH